MTEHEHIKSDNKNWKTHIWECECGFKTKFHSEFVEHHLDNTDGSDDGRFFIEGKFNKQKFIDRYPSAEHSHACEKLFGVIKEFENDKGAPEPVNKFVSI